MAEFSLPYGRGELSVSLPDEWQVELIAPKQVLALPDPSAAVSRVLDNPIGGSRLFDFAGARSAAIAINDKTRYVPYTILLPPLLRQLKELGLAPEAITLLIATGSHSPMRPDELDEVLPAEILEHYRVLRHDADDRDNLVYVGKTERDTPVWINRHFAQADLRIVTGNIEPHQFMGFSGGVKSAAIGLAGLETINHNHAMMSDSRARLGRFDDNSVRQDVEEIGHLIGVHFALNAILTDAKEILDVVAGEPQAVMQKGISLARKLYQVEVSAPFDLMIVSPGGHPKDINLYQAQKGLAHAASVTKDGGTIVLIAACPEGTGSHSYERWMEGMTSHQAVFERFRREGFRIGPHKAYQIARDAARVRVLFVTQMPSDLVRRLLLTPVSSPNEAVALVSDNLALGGPDPNRDPRVGLVSWANATIPVLKSSS